MTSIVAIVAFVLVIGIVGAVVKGLFKLAVSLAVFAAVIIGAAVFVIGGMH